MIRIEVLTVSDCPTAQQTLELVQRIAREEGVAYPVVPVLVEDAKAARQHRFLGSPSVSINGRDLEDAPHPDDYALSCRVYRDGKTLTGVPSADLIRATVRAALRLQSEGSEKP